MMRACDSINFTGATTATGRRMKTNQFSNHTDNNVNTNDYSNLMRNNGQWAFKLNPLQLFRFIPFGRTVLDAGPWSAFLLFLQWSRLYFYPLYCSRICTAHLDWAIRLFRSAHHQHHNLKHQQQQQQQHKRKRTWCSDRIWLDNFEIRSKKKLTKLMPSIRFNAFLHFGRSGLRLFLLRRKHFFVIMNFFASRIEIHIIII